mmetsp:Transcript_24723/g.40722  ORF Transcript_24723/g.40722 Transcript_24723/m.40722 type:complete len:83 (-) Transcript_24723:485-733(-)
MSQVCTSMQRYIKLSDKAGKDTEENLLLEPTARIKKASPTFKDMVVTLKGDSSNIVLIPVAEFQLSMDILTEAFEEHVIVRQ